MSSGVVEQRIPVRFGVVGRVARDLLILLAGIAAEARLTGSYNLRGTTQDLQMAQKLASLRVPNER